jgi:uncharacterized protein DUF4404
MADEHDKLRETLHQLQRQLDDVRKLDPAVAQQLDATIAEAKAALAGAPIQPAKHQSIIQRLSDAVLRYEASHPSLSGNLGSIVDALGRMGI